MKTLFWIFPDRNTKTQNFTENKYFWDLYKDAAKMVGLNLEIVSVEQIEIIHESNKSTSVYIDNKIVKESESIFITEIQTFPHHLHDYYNSINTYWSLKTLNFYLPIDPEVSLIFSDKMNTFLFFKGSSVNILPSAKIICGRDFEEHDIEKITSQIKFPVIIKPSGWGGGLGINLVKDSSDLKGILGLAAGSDLSLIIQKALPSNNLIDYRVYYINGEPHTVLLRSPKEDDFIANMSRGGNSSIVQMPDELLNLSKIISKNISLPYYCVDFLFDGKDYWFSEIEVDGAIPYVHIEESYEILKSRFIAYDEEHNKFLSKKGQINVIS